MPTHPPTPERPWRVHILSGDPADALRGDTVTAEHVADYSHARSALGMARSIVTYGELGAWHSSISHARLVAGVDLSPVVDDDGRTTSIIYRPHGRDVALLAAALWPWPGLNLRRLR